MIDVKRSQVGSNINFINSPSVPVWLATPSECKEPHAGGAGDDTIWYDVAHGLRQLLFGTQKDHITPSFPYHQMVANEVCCPTAR